MFILMSFLMVLFLILFLFLFLKLISLLMVDSFHKSFIFECGFSNMSLNRVPFSVQFFLVGILFLIFDVELSLLLPLPLMSFYIYSFILISIFCLFLLFGVLFEWEEGNLEWSH